uniref:Phospholipase A2 inhibitor and Ly6/PLAUR domain-containing protein-like n=1 Tax=Xenopus tropicalis TaxID=8364 RepID=A0A803JE43_XENTR
MTSFVGFLCVLSALVPTASSLSCITCSEKNATTCQGPSMPCNNTGAQCGSLLVSMTTDGQTLWQVGRGCFQQEQCNQPMVLRIYNSTGKQVVSCCSEDNCTPPDQTLPVDNNQPNGITCPTCFSVQPNDCSTGDTINCAGDETQCFSQTFTVSGPPTGVTAVSLQGCANGNLCTYGNYTLSSASYNVTNSIFCSNITSNSTANGNAGNSTSYFTTPNGNTGNTMSYSATTNGNDINAAGPFDANNTMGYTSNTPVTVSSDIKDENPADGCSGLQGHVLLPAAALLLLMNLLS